MRVRESMRSPHLLPSLILGVWAYGFEPISTC